MCVCVCGWVGVRALSCSLVSDSLRPHGLYSLPGSFVHGDSPGKNTGVGCHALLQGIFPTQGLNPGLLHCRQILYHLSHQGSHCYLWETPFLIIQEFKLMGWLKTVSLHSLRMGLVTRMAEWLEWLELSGPPTNLQEREGVLQIKLYMNFCCC